MINESKNEINDYNPTFPISFDKDHDPGRANGHPWFDEV